MSLFPEFDAIVDSDTSEKKPLEIPPPKRCDLYIVIAVWERDLRWAIPSALSGHAWLTRKSAEKAATKLAPGWRHRRIVRIPGDIIESEEAVLATPTNNESDH